ncbi:hypothetical protein, partial [Escherichia sp. KCJ4928]|uniref:hypothetical protein n=1 Tax=Escherichia sp. KCJ4928 TaxID=2545464 RepID=UPI00196AD813
SCPCAEMLLLCIFCVKQRMSVFLSHFHYHQPTKTCRNTLPPPSDYWTAESHRAKHDMRVSGERKAVSRGLP